MRMASSVSAATSRAAEALKSVLRQVSQIKLSSIDLDSPRPDLKIDIRAQVDVHGHRRTLLCKVRASGQPDQVRTALEEFDVRDAQFSANSIPVLIAPHFSEEGKALCREGNTGFLDLEGNARIDLGEVFIGNRSLSYARKTAQSQQVQSAGPLAGAA